IELGKSPEIFGDDYPTPDGTCIRDYIHVLDIAEAHIAISDFLHKNLGHEIFNVGTGTGYSVKEIISGIQKVTGTDFKSIIRPRRSGDLDIAFADAKLIFEKTGWKEDISNCKKFEDLPINAQKYVQYLEKISGAPMSAIGVGPGRDQTIVVKEFI
ncbi:MAG: UDP-glucose 4-epimerase GalE, partial [Actinomycetota bacterium]